MRIAIDRSSEKAAESSAHAQGGEASGSRMDPQTAMLQPAPPADLVALQELIHGRPLPEPTGNVAVQRASGAQIGATENPEQVRKAARMGITGSGRPLPHLEKIQQTFGRHDVTGVVAHTDEAAATGARAMGATAFTMGHHVAFAGEPDLRTAAHEAAHVVQQRAGVDLVGGVGQVGDRYERQADEVARRAVEGLSGENLLDVHPDFTLTAANSSNVAEHRVAIGSIQRTPTLTQDQLDAATIFNNNLHLEIGNTRILQGVLGATPTGTFDHETIRAIAEFRRNERLAVLQTSFRSNPMAAFVAGIPTRIIQEESNYGQADGQLDQATFEKLFGQMVMRGQHQLLIPLALDYFDIPNDTFINVAYEDAATSYRAVAAFSAMVIDSNTSPQTIIGAGSRLKHVFLGNPAFVAAATFRAALEAVNAITYRDLPGDREALVRVGPVLNAEQLTTARSFNDFILNEEMSRRIIQAAIGSAVSGVWDNATLQDIAAYQEENSITRRDGQLDRATLDVIIRSMVDADEHESVLRLAMDIFNLNELSITTLLRNDATVTGGPTRDRSVAGTQRSSLGTGAFADGLDGLGRALDEAFGRGTSMVAQQSTFDLIMATTDTARQNAMWSNPNQTDQAGLAVWVRDNFPTDDDLACFMRGPATQKEKVAAFGQFAVELGRLEYLMGVIFHGGADQSWENDGSNNGTFVHHYKQSVNVGDAYNAQNDWCTNFAGYVRRLLGFSNSLSYNTPGPLIFNAGRRLDSWAVANQNFLSGDPIEPSPDDFLNYSGYSISTSEFATLKQNVIAAEDQPARQRIIDTFFDTPRTPPQPGDILIINRYATNNTYLPGGHSHTTTVETYNGYVISTLEGNQGASVRGLTLDLRVAADVGHLLCLIRAGTEFYTENTPAPEVQGQPRRIVSAEDILRPMRHMVRNLQVMADRRNYIHSNDVGASVAAMSAAP